MDTLRFGDPQRFAAEVGEYWQGQRQLRRVDLWAAGAWLTCDDNTAYLPQFCRAVRTTADWLRSGHDLTPPFPARSPEEIRQGLAGLDEGLRERFGFLNWGPTTDNVLAHVFRVAENHLAITVEFWRKEHPRPDERGVVLVVEISDQEFLGVLDQMLLALEGWKTASVCSSHG